MRNVLAHVLTNILWNLLQWLDILSFSLWFFIRIALRLDLVIFLCLLLYNQLALWCIWFNLHFLLFNTWHLKNSLIIIIHLYCNHGIVFFGRPYSWAFHLGGSPCAGGRLLMFDSQVSLYWSVLLDCKCSFIVFFALVIYEGESIKRFRISIKLHDMRCRLRKNTTHLGYVLHLKEAGVYLWITIFYFIRRMEVGRRYIAYITCHLYRLKTLLLLVFFMLFFTYILYLGLYVRSII